MSYFSVLFLSTLKVRTNSQNMMYRLFVRVRTNSPQTFVRVRTNSHIVHIIGVFLYGVCFNVCLLICFVVLFRFYSLFVFIYCLCYVTVLYQFFFESICCSKMRSSCVCLLFFVFVFVFPT